MAACANEAEQTGPGPTQADGPAMTVAALCDEIEPKVLQFTGTGAKRSHFDSFADDDDMPSLVCEWYDASSTREIRVIYFGSPAVWAATDTEGKQTLAAVDAENAYEAGRLDIHATNGWTITVVAFEGIPPAEADARDALASIGNAALGASR